MLSGVLFLAAYTARSQAYAQAMAARSLDPEHMLLYGEAPAPTPLQPYVRSACGVDLPDLSIPLEQTARSRGWRTSRVPERELSAPALAHALCSAQPRAIVFSGYSAQIVPGSLLALGAPFLHAHAGWLPDYRGSTTIYYSMLNDRRCGASVLGLAARIDSGPIYARKEYPLPPPGVDVDLVYDNAIRADLLCEVLEGLRDGAELAPPLPHQEREGLTYYVIHPVLKHLALLSLGAYP